MSQVPLDILGQNIANCSLIDGRTTRKQSAQQKDCASSSVPVQVPPNELSEPGSTQAQPSGPSNAITSRSSAEPGIIYDEAQHTGPASGLAFLQEAG